METREPLRIDEDNTAATERYGNPLVVVGEQPKSALFVPLVTGGTATGVVSLQNLDREHAFTDSDQQLLETLARSLSVALENARLVHETRQRNAELALINSVQAAIAGELDPQAIYDLVGDKIQEIFDAQVVDIGIYDEASGLLHFPYAIERGVALPGRADRADRVQATRDRDREAAPDRRGRGRHGREVRQPAARRRDAEGGALRAARCGRQGDGRHLAPEPRPGARVHRFRPAAPGDPGQEPQRRARERAARARDAAAQRRARADQQRPGGDRRRARPAGDLRPRRRQDPGDLRRPGRRHRHVRFRGRAHALPVRDRARRPLPGRALAAVLTDESGTARDQGGRSDQRRAGLGGGNRRCRSPWTWASRRSRS